jgi:hypothetical protein
MSSTVLAILTCSFWSVKTVTVSPSVTPPIFPVKVDVWNAIHNAKIKLSIFMFVELIHIINIIVQIIFIIQFFDSVYLV